MARGESDHGIGRESFRGADGRVPPVDEPALGGGSERDTEEDRVRGSVWDEPALHAAGIAAPAGANTYADWYQRNRHETTWGDALGVTLLLAFAGGPFAIVGALTTVNGGATGLGFLLVVVVAPVLEEMLKAGAALITLERKPYLFLSAWQIVFAVAASGLFFAVIENLLYIFVYLEDPSPELVQWRWTVCTFLHVGCSTIASLGLVRMYRKAHRNSTPPDVRLASPLLVTAILLHGGYNASALILDFFVTPM